MNFHPFLFLALHIFWRCRACAPPKPIVAWSTTGTRFSTSTATTATTINSGTSSEHSKISTFSQENPRSSEYPVTVESSTPSIIKILTTAESTPEFSVTVDRNQSFTSSANSLPTMSSEGTPVVTSTPRFSYSPTVSDVPSTSTGASKGSGTPSGQTSESTASSVDTSGGGSTKNQEKLSTTLTSAVSEQPTTSLQGNPTTSEYTASTGQNQSSTSSGSSLSTLSFRDTEETVSSGVQFSSNTSNAPIPFTENSETTGSTLSSSISFSSSTDDDDNVITTVFANQSPLTPESALTPAVDTTVLTEASTISVRLPTSPSSESITSFSETGESSTTILTSKPAGSFSTSSKNSTPDPPLTIVNYTIPLSTLLSSTPIPPTTCDCASPDKSIDTGLSFFNKLKTTQLSTSCTYQILCDQNRSGNYLSVFVPPGFSPNPDNMQMFRFYPVFHSNSTDYFYQFGMICMGTQWYATRIPGMVDMSPGANRPMVNGTSWTGKFRIHEMKCQAI